MLNPFNSFMCLVTSNFEPRSAEAKLKMQVYILCLIFICSRLHIRYKILLGELMREKQST